MWGRCRAPCARWRRRRPRRCRASAGRWRRAGHLSFSLERRRSAEFLSTVFHRGLWRPRGRRRAGICSRRRSLPGRRRTRNIGKFSSICNGRRCAELRTWRRRFTGWSRSRRRRSRWFSGFLWSFIAGLPGRRWRWRRASSTTRAIAGALRANCIRLWRRRWRRRRRSLCFLLLLSGNRGGVPTALFLLDIRLDEVRILCNLIFGDSHLHELVQNAFVSWITGIERRSLAWRAAGRRRRRSSLCWRRSLG